MRRSALILAGALAAAVPARAGAPGLSGSFLYMLSDTTGRIPYSWPSIAWDPSSAELYVVSSGLVDVFSENGMAVYGFANDTGFGPPSAVTVLPSGELYVLAGQNSETALVRCNYRGEPLGKIDLKGLPTDFAAGFEPSALANANGKLYLADKIHAKVAIVAPDGAVQKTFDFQESMGIDERHRPDAEMRAFNVDAKGDMLFTFTTLFTAYVVSPEGKARAFGMKGSAPGRFGNCAGIAADGDGHIYVSDTLRAVVLVFDAGDLHFIGEFGGMRAPSQIAAMGGKVYVAQSMGGIRVFGVRFD